MNKFSWYKFIIIYLLSVYSITTTAQKLDSVGIQKLRQQAEICDSVGHKAILTLGGYYYRQKDSNNLRFYTNREIECAQTQSDKRKLTEAYFHQVLYHQAFSNGDSVVQSAEFLLTFLENDTTAFSKKHKVRALIQLGASYYYQSNNHEKAYAYYQQAKDLALEIGDLNRYLEVVRDLSKFFTLEKAYSKAIQIADDALARIKDVEKKKLNEFLLVGVKYNRAKAIAANPLSDSLAIREAHEVYKEQLEYLTKNDRKFEIRNTLAEMLIAFKDYFPTDTLLVYGYKGINLDEKYITTNRDPKLYRFHGRNLIDAGRYKEAQTTLNTALYLAKSRSKWYTSISDIYDALITTNLRLGQRNQAEENFNSYKIYLDSVQIAERENALETIEAKYQLSQKESENLLLKKESESLAARSKFLTAIGALLLLLLGLGIYFYNIQRTNTQKITKLNETKNKIFMILAHDLKGPSLIFNNLAKKLSYLITKNDTNRLQELAVHYEESGRKVSGTINRVLDWAISEKETFVNNPEQLELLPLVKNSIQDFEYDLQQKKLNIKIDIPSGQTIIFDPNAFAIINRNVLHNAIKYAPINSDIKIIFNNQAKALEYIDQGTGFNQNKAKKIMQRIPVVSEKGTLEETGTGIGLVTCVGLSSSNNSQISFLNLPEGGTKVSLQFAA